MTAGRNIDAPSSRLMQARIQAHDAANGVTHMHFVAPESFASPRGYVHGGLVAGFLDEVMGAAVLGVSEGKLLPLNLNSNISYLRPVPLGKLKGEGRVLKMGRNIAYLEGKLCDDDGNILIHATSTAMLTEVPDGKI